jgi:hypothetical protein
MAMMKRRGLSKKPAIQHFVMQDNTERGMCQPRHLCFFARQPLP